MTEDRSNWGTFAFDRLQSCCHCRGDPRYVRRQRKMKHWTSQLCLTADKHLLRARQRFRLKWIFSLQIDKDVSKTIINKINSLNHLPTTTTVHPRWAQRRNSHPVLWRWFATYETRNSETQTQSRVFWCGMEPNPVHSRYC